MRERNESPVPERDNYALKILLIIASLPLFAVTMVTRVLAPGPVSTCRVEVGVGQRFV